jgi:hypothetical protein
MVEGGSSSRVEPVGSETAISVNSAPCLKPLERERACGFLPAAGCDQRKWDQVLVAQVDGGVFAYRALACLCRCSANR